MCKKVSDGKLNGFIANNKANECISVLGLSSVEKTVVLSKVVLRTKAFRRESGIPFYAFVKQAGDQTILVDVVSGSAKAVANHLVAAQANVRGRFTIGGVTYDQKDTICGMPRYKVVGSKMKSYNRVY